MTTSRSKATGSQAERDVVAFAQANGFPGAHRMLPTGGPDMGDVALCPGVIVQVKFRAYGFNWSDIDTWLAQTAVQQRNARADLAVLVVKRKGINVGQWWAVWPHPDHKFPLFCWLGAYLTGMRRDGWGSGLDAAGTG